MPQGDQILGTSSAMQAAATSFHNHVIDFDQKTTNLNNAVIELANSWFGGGYDTFSLAWGK